MDPNDNNPSTSSTDDDEPKNKVCRKRYKLPLYANYEAGDVMRQTRKKWESTFLDSYQDFQIQSTSSVLKNIDVSSEEVNDSSSSSNGAPNVNCNQQKTTVDVCKNKDYVQTLPSTSNSDIIINPNEENNTGCVHSNLDNYNTAGEDDPESSNLDETELIINDTENDRNIYFGRDENQLFSSDNNDTDDDYYTDVGNVTDDVFCDRLMFEKSGLKIRDIVIMTTALSLRFGMSNEARSAVIDLLKVCAGPEFDDINFSNYKTDKCFSAQEDHITYHYYCNKCKKPTIVYNTIAKDKIMNHNCLCENCKQQIMITSSSSNYFITVDLAYQLKQVMQDEKILENILTNVQNSHSCDSSIIKDVSDGFTYSKIRSYNRNNNIDNKYMLTLNYSTDGAPLTKSGKKGFWPLQVYINDISPKLRHQFILLTGILLVEKEPDSSLLNLYLSKFVEMINELCSTGIEIRKHNSIISFRFCALNCIVDSVCRPIMQNRLQFNGYYGCSWCYQFGLYIKTAHGIRYPFDQDSIDRTHSTHEEDVKLAKESGKNTRGVKGESALQNLPFIDIVWSFPYEYMHGICLGVASYLWNEWKSEKCIYKIQKKDVIAIEKRFLAITPTHDIHRLPRSGIVVGTAKPKATEQKSWLLFYSLPCLREILNEEVLKHYALLVKSVYTLLQTAISKNALDECEQDLMAFVCFFEMYYGQEKMTFNVHALLHIVQSVKNTGPLCFNSSFPFESNIYTLKRFVTGPKGMDQQMAQKHVQKLLFKTGLKRYSCTSESTKRFCQSLFKHKQSVTASHSNAQNVTYFGRGRIRKMTNGEHGYCLLFAKCIYNETVYHSTNYSRAKKTDDTVIKLSTGKYGRIQHIIKYNDDCFLEIKYFEIASDDPFEGVNHIKKVTSESTTSVTIPISDVTHKIIFINVSNVKYLCTLPNTLEVQ